MDNILLLQQRLQMAAKIWLFKFIYFVATRGLSALVILASEQCLFPLDPQNHGQINPMFLAWLSCIHILAPRGRDRSSLTSSLRTQGDIEDFATIRCGKSSKSRLSRGGGHMSHPHTRTDARNCVLHLLRYIEEPCSGTSRSVQVPVFKSFTTQLPSPATPPPLLNFAWLPRGFFRVPSFSLDLPG
ncbi:hypothetical protein GALMADRAFT_408261 [Galerina marginata CBS 339.88]|uniref:Uncharacterized protein n=1 Tax=Galerina marginata (strain CBS 339.88) TaxID=685588 RepID=A0A067T5H0_GALM3|nr:hypothetical protein GALMADRAFT_408261 [Galerina marginata CBS 339.88]